MLSSDHRAKPSGRKLARKLIWRGLPISIESDVGHERHWTAPDGTPGVTVLRNAYGYVRLTRGSPEPDGEGGFDHDHIDVFLGDDMFAPMAYVIRQHEVKADGSQGPYVEDKVFLGFASAEQACASFDAHYDRPGFRGDCDEITFEKFVAHCVDRSNWGHAVRKAILLRVEKAKASRESWRRSVRKYEANPKNLSKMRAKWAVQAAVRSGKLKKPEVCPRCKLKRPLQFHHTSYARADWLKGSWKCRPCHVQSDPVLSGRNGKMSRSVKNAQKKAKND